VTALLLALALPASAGAAPSPSFRGGPAVLDQIPAGRGDALGAVSVEEALKGKWPQELLGRLQANLAQGRAVLLVGHTDPVGPRALNRSLGLQYAAEASRRLARELGVDLSRFACASEGEEGPGKPGVTAFALPASVSPLAMQRVTLLEPVGTGASCGRLWGFWDQEGTGAEWALSGPEGETVWEADPGQAAVSVPCPPRASRAALGVAFPGEGPRVAGSDQPPAPEEPALALRLTGQGAWVAHLTGRLPSGWHNAVVWAGGVPYPVLPGQEGRFEADVVLMPAAGRAYAQALDPVGRLAVGPVLALPDGEGDPPGLIAVLVWEAGEADLDLHGWSGERHTHPQDPDAAFSQTAVPGARLLFDGDGGRPASALAASGVESLDLEAQCYSDLGGEGSRAWLYVLAHPGDPLRERRRVLGPRRLSGRAVEVRWPILSWKGE
jgi:hypothetical protein